MQNIVVTVVRCDCLTRELAAWNRRIHQIAAPIADRPTP